MVLQIVNEQKKGGICKEILEALPDWFGIQESIVEYTNLSMKLPMWADIEDNQVRGFIVLKETSPYTAEICVMGVKKEFHRKGIGRDLFCAMHEFAKKQNYEFVQVKTVKEGLYDAYNLTNAFYKRLGFKELECFPMIWDEVNPCQIYIMAIDDFI